MEKTWEIREQELREEIAQAIEAIEPSTNVDDIKTGHLLARNWAASIARGTVQR
jgi:hypothetical protein